MRWKRPAGDGVWSLEHLLVAATSACLMSTSRLLDKAHEACLITRSVSSEVVVEPTVEIAHPEPVLV